MCAMGGMLHSQEKEEGTELCRPTSLSQVAFLPVPVWPTLAWNQKERRDSRKGHSQLKQANDRTIQHRQYLGNLALYITYDYVHYM